jgi:hypothetical protein
MGLREHQIGKGTLGYHGETAEYYESKRGVWDVARWVIAAVLLVIGVGFLVASTSPIVTARVVAVVDDPAAGADQVTLVAPDGASTTVTRSYADSYRIGDLVEVRSLPGGRLVPGDLATEGRGAAAIFLTIGIAMIGWAVYRVVRPRQRTTTVLAPDDVYALGPRS